MKTLMCRFYFCFYFTHLLLLFQHWRARLLILLWNQDLYTIMMRIGYELTYILRFSPERNGSFG